MAFEEALALLMACWCMGWVLGFKLRQLYDALNAS